jgi:hypothetical protein
MEISQNVAVVLTPKIHFTHLAAGQNSHAQEPQAQQIGKIVYGYTGLENLFEVSRPQSLPFIFPG